MLVLGEACLCARVCMSERVYNYVCTRVYERLLDVARVGDDADACVGVGLELALMFVLELQSVGAGGGAGAGAGVELELSWS